MKRNKERMKKVAKMGQREKTSSVMDVMGMESEMIVDRSSFVATLRSEDEGLDVIHLSDAIVCSGAWHVKPI